MTRKSFALLVMCLVLPSLAGNADAQTKITVTDGDEAAAFNPAEGWSQTNPGVWERHTKDGRIETFVSSAEGLSSVLPRLRDKEKQLLAAYLTNATEANKRALDAQADLVQAVAANVASATSREKSAGPAAAVACTRTYGYTASIGQFHCIHASRASASYSVSDAVSCPEQCTVHAYSYAQTTSVGACGTPTVNSDSCDQTGTNVSCTTYADTVYGNACYHYAFASVHCPQLSNLFLSVSDSSTACVCPC